MRVNLDTRQWMSDLKLCNFSLRFLPVVQLRLAVGIYFSTESLTGVVKG